MSNTPGERHARLWAATTALSALLLLVALCILALVRAPWWALCGVQGALLVAATYLGMLRERARWLGLSRKMEGLRAGGPGDPQWWTHLERAATGPKRRPGAGPGAPHADDDDVFWQEFLPKERRDDA